MKCGQQVTDHFEDILEMVSIGSGAQRKAENVKLSRYACYLIVQKRKATSEDKQIEKTTEKLPKK